MEIVVDELGAVFISIGAGICVIMWIVSLLAYVSVQL